MIGRKTTGDSGKAWLLQCSYNCEVFVYLIIIPNIHNIKGNTTSSRTWFSIIILYIISN